MSPFCILEEINVIAENIQMIKIKAIFWRLLVKT